MLNEARVKDQIEQVIARYRTGLNFEKHSRVPDVILEESRKYGFDPMFLTAVIVAESSFYNWAKSQRGALGLMQIRPHTARALASETEVVWQGKLTLYDPIQNISLGAYYLNKLIELGKQIFGGVMQVLPQAQVRPIPALDLGNPELRIFPNRERLTRLGMTTNDLGTTVNALVDGAKASTYRLYGDEIDLIVKRANDSEERTQDLAGLPVISPGGEKVTLGSLADIRLEEGPTQINHIDSERAITIQVIPPREISLEAAMDMLNERIVAPIKKSGTLSSLYSIHMGGTADNLTRTRQALQWNFILAVVICYLLMASLFENFLYPFIILFSVPLAAAGGFIGIFLVNRYIAYQPLDILTMLGFVILIGIVVNNAILIVHQTLFLVRNERMHANDAIIEAVRNRIHTELLRLAHEHPAGENAAAVSPPPTHAEIASRVSTHREAVTRELNRLAHSGLLERRSNTLAILDVAGLRQLVQETGEP